MSELDGVNVFKIEILPSDKWKLRGDAMESVTMGVRRPGPKVVEVALMPDKGRVWSDPDNVPTPRRVKALVAEHFGVTLGAFDEIEQGVAYERQLLLYTFHYPPGRAPADSGVDL